MNAKKTYPLLSWLTSSSFSGQIKENMVAFFIATTTLRCQLKTPGWLDEFASAHSLCSCALEFKLNIPLWWRLSDWSEEVVSSGKKTQNSKWVCCRRQFRRQKLPRNERPIAKTQLIVEISLVALNSVVNLQTVSAITKTRLRGQRERQKTKKYL